MYRICLGFSVFCFIYYIICVRYAGFGSAFVSVWLYAGCVSFILFLVLRYIKVRNIVVHGGIRTSFFVLLLSGVIVFLLIEGFIITHMLQKPKENSSYIIVLGAQIKGTKVSKSLKLRLDTALEYALKNPDTHIIVSGGQGVSEDISEAEAMKSYLVENGIETNRITKEDQSFNTDQNIRNSARIINDSNSSIVIVTSNFHIFRALQLAKAAGFTELSAAPSPCSCVLFLNYMVRESIGVTKDFLVGNFRRR